VLSWKHGWRSGKTLASHHCDHEFDPRTQLRLLLILSLTSTYFLRFFSGFPPSAKINISKFQFDHGLGTQIYQLIANKHRATLVKQSWCYFKWSYWAYWYQDGHRGIDILKKTSFFLSKFYSKEPWQAWSISYLTSQLAASQWEIAVRGRNGVYS
jgi:hypothetical protein